MTNEAQRNEDTVEPLVRLTVPQRLMAAERFYREHNAAMADGLRLAIAIVQPDGWQHIAPAWARGIAEEDNAWRESKAHKCKHVWPAGTPHGGGGWRCDHDVQCGRTVYNHPSGLCYQHRPKPNAQVERTQKASKGDNDGTL